MEKIRLKKNEMDWLKIQKVWLIKWEALSQKREDPAQKKKRERLSQNTEGPTQKREALTQ